MVREREQERKREKQRKTSQYHPTPGFPHRGRTGLRGGETCCRPIISRSTSRSESKAMISLWHIRDLQNEAQSGIKSPNGKQLILLVPGRQETSDPVILDGTGIQSSLQIVLPNSSGMGVRAKGGGLGEKICVAR